MENVAGDDRFVRGYAVEATDRLRGTEFCERAGYLRYGHAPDAEAGLVSLVLRGETKRIVEAKRDRWDELVGGGLAEDWTVEDHPRRVRPDRSHPHRRYREKKPLTPPRRTGIQ